MLDDLERLLNANNWNGIQVRYVLFPTNSAEEPFSESDSDSSLSDYDVNLFYDDDNEKR